ncbi:MAG: hypothetical protein JRN62_09895 [Nitrososphaerota archaeon]|jgi:hypothetical protein|nr:hypothetical protein [Nitrososphaerota archaeon]
MGGRKRIYDDVAPLAEERTVATWLKTLRETGRTAALYHLASWVRWRKEKGLQANPDRLIEECLDGNNRTLVAHLQLILEYCQGPRFEGDTLESRKRHYNSIRGFYAANLVGLPRRKLKDGETNGKVRQEVTAMEFLKMFKQALEYTGVRDRALMLCALQGGMDDSTLARVFNITAFPQLARHFGTSRWKDWADGLCPVRIDLVRPKSGERFYTYQDVDAIEALKVWFDIRGEPEIHDPESPQDLPTSEPIFIGRFGSISPATVGQTFRSSGKRAKVNVHRGLPMETFKGARLRYPFHSHEVMDTLITLARRAKADVAAANFFTGHSIDKLKYDKSPWDDEGHFRSEYLKIARPYLNPISGKVLEVEAELSRKLEERLARLEEEMREYASRMSGQTAGPRSRS